MPATPLLFLDGRHVTAMRWQVGKVDVVTTFADSQVGQESLVEHCRSEGSHPVMFLADIAEEGFQLDNIPHLQGSDRKAMLSRRLGQYFYGTPYATAISLGRDTTGRRDERVQFAALTRPEIFTPWLTCLNNERIPIRGVYSVPLVLARMRFAFASGWPRFILVTLTPGGLRQTFFDEGKMRFSRLSQLPNTQIASIGSLCSRETTKTVQYLLGQRQIARGTKLPVFMLAHPSDHEALAASCQSSGDVNYQFIDLPAFAKEQGYKGTLESSFMERLIGHSLALHPPSDQFAPAADRHMYRLWQTRFGLRAAALVLASSGVLVGAKLSFDASDINTQTEQLRSSAARSQQQYQTILSGLPLVSVTPANLRAVIASVDDVQAHSPAINAALGELGRVLPDFPGIELTQLKWHAADKPASAPTNGAGQNGVGQSAAGQANSPQVSAGNTAIPPATSWSVIDIHGRLPLSMQSDQRRQIETVNQLAAALIAPNKEAPNAPSNLILILAMPVDIQSDKALRSDTRSNAEVAGSKNFHLQLSVPYSPATPSTP
jgi:hypothetical protein